MSCGWWKWKSIFVRFCLILQDLTWTDFNPSLIYAYLNPSNFEAIDQGSVLKFKSLLFS